MKQVAQNYKSGELQVLDVPPPACKPGGALIRSHYSLISAGTELMKVSEARLSLAGKARARPDQVRRLLDSVAQQGAVATYTKAMRQLDSLTSLGYSLCGTIEETGEGAGDLRAGQLVACAGNEFALHAEVNWVPRRLCVPVPPGVDPRLAAFATVGAIAMHGVRRCEPQLGDTACVVGLGLVGQLAVQLLVAAGVRVVGLDVAADRCRLAERAGAVVCAAPDATGLRAVERSLGEFGGVLGADHVILAAGGSSNGPVQAAARLARDRARVVDIGKLRLDLPWNAFYEKELEVRFSRSSGPGRYDATYELEGIDYPAGYVRWTEERNIACFLDLVARGALRVDLLVSATFPIEEAPSVYERLRSGELHSIGVLFEYPTASTASTVPASAASHVASTVPNASRRSVPCTKDSLGAPPTPRARRGDEETAGSGLAGVPWSAGRSNVAPRVPTLRLGFVGAGSYACSVLLPALASRGDVELAVVATATSLSAANAQRRFGFRHLTTEADRVIEAEDVDAVFIATRHHSHAELVCRSLSAGKPTFVEKPLALSDEQLARVVEAARSSGNDRLMVGFNRRFAPLLCELRERFGQHPGGVVHYHVNAGQLPAGSWYADEALEGSRFAGEGGHFIDTIGWWLGSRPVRVHAMQAGSREDVHVTITYEDRSVASIDYTTQGSPRAVKEAMVAVSGGCSARFENFQGAWVWEGRRRWSRRSFGPICKGQRQELDRFLHALQMGVAMPIPFGSLVGTTRATLAAGHSLRTGGSVPL